jgi:hypothetical protein
LSSSKVSEPLSKWELMQEASERARLRAMDDAFRASLAAAIKRGEEKEPERTIYANLDLRNSSLEHFN